MKGLSIEEIGFSDTPPDLKISTFAVFFKPILPQLEKIHWLYETQPFSYSPEPTGELVKALVEMPDNNGYFAPSTLLPKFAAYVCDDWSSLFGFYAMPNAPLIFAHLNPRNYQFMSRNIDFFFFSIDGAYWNFYTKNETILKIVAEHAKSLAGVQFEWVDFANFTN